MRLFTTRLFQSVKPKGAPVRRADSFQKVLPGDRRLALNPVAKPKRKPEQVIYLSHLFESDNRIARRIESGALAQADAMDSVFDPEQLTCGTKAIAIRSLRKGFPSLLVLLLRGMLTP